MNSQYLRINYEPYFFNQSPRLIICSLLLLCFPAFSSELLTIKNDLKEQLIILDATIEAADQATLSAQTSGRVVKINFDTSDYVEQGRVLLEITRKSRELNWLLQKQTFYEPRRYIMNPV